MIDAAHSLSHRTTLMVLYSTGMRNAELRHLQVADLDSRQMVIHIRAVPTGTAALPTAEKLIAGAPFSGRLPYSHPG